MNLSIVAINVATISHRSTHYEASLDIIYCKENHPNTLNEVLSYFYLK